MCSYDRGFSNKHRWKPTRALHERRWVYACTVLFGGAGAGWWGGLGMGGCDSGKVGDGEKLGDEKNERQEAGRYQGYRAF